MRQWRNFYRDPKGSQADRKGHRSVGYQPLARCHNRGIDTFVLPCRPDLNFISSSASKKVCKLKGNTEAFVPLDVKQLMESRLNRQFRVGLTGTIASGKSTIAHEIVRLGTRAGLQVHNIDLDSMAHDILFNRAEPAYVNLRMKLQQIWGILEWSRKTVGQMVFTDSNARALLDQEMQDPLRTRLRHDLAGKTGIVLLNGALLVEAGWSKLVNNFFILLDVAEEDQMRRLLARGHTAEQCRKRIGAQFSTSEKARRIKDSIAAGRYGDVFVCETRSGAEATASTILEKIQMWAKAAELA